MKSKSSFIAGFVVGGCITAYAIVKRFVRWANTDIGKELVSEYIAIRISDKLYKKE